ncbi:MAG: TIGR00725 family protein [Deltaproteobacteria bacterium]|nr:TIGR00725 family protein [Deltaproteobacteria bacterium]
MIQSGTRRTVAVIGDQGAPEGTRNYSLGQQVGALLCEAGFRVVTGGLGGIMEAASRGARECPAWTPGTVIALLPGFDPERANAWADVVVPTGLDHLRNSLVAQADAVVAIGGGAGTLTEIALAWIYRRPIVALRVDGWSGELADRRIDDRVRYDTIPDDRVFGAGDAAEAVKIVRERIEQYSRRHSRIR